MNENTKDEEDCNVNAAFDFTLRDKEYFFLEVNPTGEWAWLVDAVGYPIPKTIANALQRSPHVN